MCQIYPSGIYVRYGGRGICLIERIEEVQYSLREAPRRCYVLKPLRTANTEISVPLDSEPLCARMRPLLKAEEIYAMLDKIISEAPMEWIEDRKLRSASFRKILLAGDTLGLLQLIYCIVLHQIALKRKGKHLSGTDEAIKKDAERMIDEEFAFSLNLQQEEVSRYIHERLKLHEQGVPQSLQSYE